jgi:hypothetical protein
MPNDTKTLTTAMEGGGVKLINRLHGHENSRRFAFGA